MFWKKKDKKGKKTGKEVTTSGSNRPTREQIIAQAKMNASKARAEIGEETLQKIAEALRRKEQSVVEQAKNKIKSMDQEKVVSHLKMIIDEKVE